MKRLKGWDLALGVLVLVLLGLSLGLALNRSRLTLFVPFLPPLPQGVLALPLDGAISAYQQDQVIFVDAREAVRYRAGHIAGAVNIEPDSTDLSALPETGMLVIYCDGPECGASGRLAARLQALGRYQIRVLRAGWPAWEQAGLPRLEEGP